ncbi:hypothetical protein J4230_02825 [Candidatus Woesearchaeota archaeon]|nr:hypothetical protein [Candidatus Woesearchaeota archaeon]
MNLFKKLLIGIGLIGATSGTPDISQAVHRPSDIYLFEIKYDKIKEINEIYVKILSAKSNSIRTNEFNSFNVNLEQLIKNFEKSYAQAIKAYNYYVMEDYRLHEYINYLSDTLKKLEEFKKVLNRYYVGINQIYNRKEIDKNMVKTEILELRKFVARLDVVRSKLKYRLNLAQSADSVFHRK